MALICLMMLGGCGALRTQMATVYAYAQKTQITVAMRNSFAKNPMTYFVGTGPITPTARLEKKALVRHGILEIARLSTPYDAGWNHLYPFGLRLTARGAKLARRDAWRAFGPVFRVYAVPVGLLAFQRIVSVHPVFSRIPPSIRHRVRSCYLVKYLARFVLTKAGRDLRRVDSPNGGPVLGQDEFFLLHIMGVNLEQATSFSDAGKLVAGSLTVCQYNDASWRAPYPPAGSL